MSSNELKYITLNCVDSSDPNHFWFIIPSDYLMFTRNRQIMMVNGSGGYRINSLFLRKTNFGYLYRFSKKCFFYCKLLHLYKPTILSEDFVVNIRFLKEKKLKFIYKKLDVGGNEIDSFIYFTRKRRKEKIKEEKMSKIVDI